MALTSNAAWTIDAARAPCIETCDLGKGVTLTLTSAGMRIVVITVVVTAHDSGPRAAEEIEQD